ncbi:MAG: hypothetical protein CMK89_11530 [Pseudomonadales bacterium]|nr:hypothetical protein [Pseudomonadales bacterium]
MYYYGRGVPQSYETAATWFERASEQGSADAQYNLGIYYYNGSGVTKDHNQAHFWRDQAARSGNKNAVTNKGILIKQMSPDELNKSCKLSSKGLP